MKQATTPLVRLRTNVDLTSMTEIRVALTRNGGNAPAYIKTLTGGTVTVKDSTDAYFRLSQEEATHLRGVVTVDMRAKTADGNVYGFKRGYLRSKDSFDLDVI